MPALVILLTEIGDLFVSKKKEIGDLGCIPHIWLLFLALGAPWDSHEKEHVDRREHASRT
jgi:hypothetical protein